MGSEFDKQKLQSCLAQSVIVCELRDILTKTGIPSDEIVKLHIKYNDEILVSHEIPKKSPKINVTQQVTDLAAEIDDFFNKAEAFDGLLSALPESKSSSSTDETTRTVFQLTFDIGIFCFEELDIQYPRLQINKPLLKCCPPYPCHVCC